MPNKKPYILSHPFFGPTVRILSSVLGLRRSYIPLEYPPTIRWGNSKGKYLSGDTTINSPGIIRACGNKLVFSRSMDELEIPHIRINQEIPERFPVLIRKTLTGSQGRGIVVCETFEDFMKNGGEKLNWTYWHDFSSEFGVHFVGGNIVKLFRKERAEGLEPEKFPIKNLDKGYSFVRVNPETKPKLINFMKGVYEKFPVEFGRFDVGYDRNLRSYVIIEANSAPGISENDDTLNHYVEFFKSKL